MTLYFITGNAGKFAEAKKFFPEVEQLNLDLPEIQELDSRKVIEEKLKEAVKQLNSEFAEFFIEDTSLHLDCLKGFPGPLVKWLHQAVGNEGLFDLVERQANSRAEVRSVIGYVRKEKEETIFRFFEGKIWGKIVFPRGEKDFAWGASFQPDGFLRTFGEMEREDKNQISMRGEAFRKLRDYLGSNPKKSL